MPNIPFEQIVDINLNLRRYRFDLEIESGIKLYEMLDFEEEQQFATIGFMDQPVPVAEIFWRAGDGFARLIEPNQWVQIEGEPFQNQIQLTCDLIRSDHDVSIREEQEFWVLEYSIPVLPVHDQMDEILNSVFHGELSERRERFVSIAEEKARSLDGVQRIWISRESYLIQRIDVETKWEGGEKHAVVEISPLEEQIPEVPEEIFRRPLPSISLGMTLYHLEDIGGWNTKESHSVWTQKVLDLIKSSETNKPKTDKIYSEIYDKGWSTKAYSETDGKNGVNPKLGIYHPLVVGSHNEDAQDSLKSEYDAWFSGDKQFNIDPTFYYSNSTYRRYYHHFGGDGVGLEDEWYFVFHTPPATTKGNRFYSARDWAYGAGRINENLNRLTFTRAIEQYHRYTKKGKRLAYLMLGHVLHLLEDVGQPDHAALVDHAGSGMNEVEAYKTYHYCHFLATEAALAAAAACGPLSLVCGLGAFGIAEAACWASASKDVVGYEKLIADHWSLSRINPTAITRKQNFDAYFHALAQNGMNKVNNKGLSYALGCGTLMLVPPIPNADPSIDATSSNEKNKYLNLTDEIVPDIIETCAGLVEHFYDIVNYPPFLEKIKIVQFEPRAEPESFGVLRKDAPNHCTRYDAEWVKSGSLSRSLVIHKKQQLVLDYPVYAFLLFGPSKIFPSISKRMKNVRLKLKGTDPATGNNIDIDVPLTEEEDSKLGIYYWGEFSVSNCSSDEYTLFINVGGKDYGPHDNNRNPSGDNLDSDPSTMPCADIMVPQFPWKGYTPGIDQYHKVQISVPIWEIAVDPPGKITLQISLREIREVFGEKQLTIKQKTWDCHWEPVEGLPTCPIEWDISPVVTWTSPRGIKQNVRRSSLIFDISLTPRDGYSTRLKVTANPNVIRRPKLGHYELTVNCNYGHFHKSVLIVIEIV